ncbi:hypothetical protein VNO78_06349 [Psophocarpus tetragonolobus]|uniref:EGF-like domain-containing protein n=1 Tax=Psophocarpus tetragonolobus TaxID=3891 RepID=A0AAN9SU33_PSOTE
MSASTTSFPNYSDQRRDLQRQHPQAKSSFDYPSDTLLSGMRIGWDLKKGLNWSLTAWKNWDDPSPGDFTATIFRTNNPEDVMWKGTTLYYRSGPSLDGAIFSGSPSSSAGENYKIVSNKHQFYVTYSMDDKYLNARIVLNQTQYLRQRLTWNRDSQSWRLSTQAPSDLCDYYNTCGPFGICDVGQTPVCKCLDGFKPKSPQNWSQMNWNEGCVHNQTWSCRKKDKDAFQKFSKVKAPETTKSWVNATKQKSENPKPPLDLEGKVYSKIKYVLSYGFHYRRKQRLCTYHQHCHKLIKEDGWNLKKGLNWSYTAWKNWDDPSPGDLTITMSRSNNPEQVMWKGSRKYYRTGPWDGTKFSGAPSVSSNSLITYTTVSQNDEFSATYSRNDKSVISIIVINQTLSVRQHLIWNNDSESWRLSTEFPSDVCDEYNTCEAFGICDGSEAPLCKCIDGFKPKSPQNWSQMNWNDGCVHNQTWSCREKDKDSFHKFSNVKAPETTRSWVNAIQGHQDGKENLKTKVVVIASVVSAIQRKVDS